MDARVEPSHDDVRVIASEAKQSHAVQIEIASSGFALLAMTCPAGGVSAQPMPTRTIRSD
jgi:hypothetical protein